MLRLQSVRGIFNDAKVVKDLGTFQSLDAIYQYANILFNSPAYVREIGSLEHGEIFLDYGSHIYFLRVTAADKIVEQEKN